MELRTQRPALSNHKTHPTLRTTLSLSLSGSLRIFPAFFFTEQITSSDNAFGFYPTDARILPRRGYRTILVEVFRSSYEVFQPYTGIVS
jgi:hypothetical protein